jgi:DNA-binding response OmpR family regulator
MEGAAVRLLVVEDTPKMSDVLARAFREDGYAVDVQATGAKRLCTSVAQLDTQRPTRVTGISL